MVVSVVPQTANNMAYLQQLEQAGVIQFWGPEWKSLDGRTDFQIDSRNYPAVASHLSNNGAFPSVMISDLQELLDARDKEIRQRRSSKTADEAFDFENFHPLDELVAFMQKMADTNPLVMHYPIGTSYEGRNISMVTVRVPDGQIRPVVMLECGIHAREWVAPASCIWIFHQLASGYGIDDEVTELLNAYDWIIVPSTNPDGYEYNWSRDRLWRKNRFPSATGPCVGVDSNRNFASNWGGEGSSGQPCSETYRGESVFSERESQAIRDALAAHRGRVRAYVSVHSYASLWMTPFGSTPELPSDYDEMIRAMTYAVDALEATHGTAFTLGSANVVLYTTSGGSRDYVYLTENVTYSCTIESRSTSYGFVPPASEILPTAQENWNGIKAMVFALP